MREHTNKYMNAFEPYSDGRPIENNVSRILAIALDENPLLLGRFIDIINKSLASHGENPLSKPESPEDFTVEIQQTASNIAGNFDGMRRIIPVTLPPYKAKEEENHGGANNPRTDICISCKDGEEADVIIVEVKLRSTYAEAQVKHQAQSIHDKKEDTAITEVINLTWPEIVKILLSVNSLQEGRDLLLAHYIDYLRPHYTEWFPAAPFSERMTLKEAWERNYTLMTNCANILNSVYGSRGESFSAGEAAGMYGIFFSPSWGYMQQFHVYENFSTDGKFEGITVAFWLGNNKPQSDYLFGDLSNTKDNMSWTQYTEITLSNGEKLPCTIRPYLKFYTTFGNQIMSAYPMLQALGTKKSEVLSKFPENGQWNKTSNAWSFANLKSRLLFSEPAIFDEEEAKKFKDNFEILLENSGRKVVNIALGYEIKIKIPVSDLAKLDEDFSDGAADKDSPAKPVALIVQAVRKMIEK